MVGYQDRQKHRVITRVKILHQIPIQETRNLKSRNLKPKLIRNKIKKAKSHQVMMQLNTFR